MNATPAPAAARPLTIDVWSDMVCPWCWLGKRRFELALSRRPDLHVVVTGRNAKPALIEAADLVTEMTLVKHHFAAGVKAQQGIEF